MCNIPIVELDTSFFFFPKLWLSFGGEILRMASAMDLSGSTIVGKSHKYYCDIGTGYYRSKHSHFLATITGSRYPF